MLLVVGNKAFNKPLLPSVTADDTSETLSGWHLASPRPQYKLGGKQRKPQPISKNYTPLQPVINSPPAIKGKGMTGKLTEEYDYIYEGRSIQLQNGSSKLQQQPPKHDSPHHIIPQLVLNPLVTLDRSDTMTRKARNNIHKLAQLQMKTDVFYEQMIIDEKLKRIGFNTPIRDGPQAGKTKHAAAAGLCSKSASEPYTQPMDVLSPLNVICQGSKSDTNIHSQRKPHRKFKKPRPLDWTIMGQPPAAVKSSFSRLLQSSSVILKNND